jgi:hypothetical protein
MFRVGIYTLTDNAENVKRASIQSRTPPSTIHNRSNSSTIAEIVALASASGSPSKPVVDHIFA